MQLERVVRAPWVCFCGRTNRKVNTTPDVHIEKGHMTWTGIARLKQNVLDVRNRLFTACPHATHTVHFAILLYQNEMSVFNLSMLLHL